MKIYFKYLIITAGLLTLVACGGSNNCSPNANNGDVETLQIIAPKNIYSTSSNTTGLIVIKNPTTLPIQNIHYKLQNQVGSGSSATIDSASAANCTVVAANSQCVVKINIPAGAIAGSFGIVLNNDSSVTAKQSQASALSFGTQIGIEQAAYNSISGADGITTNYYHTVIAGTPYILVNGIVSSNNAGNFNSIVLVSQNGTAIPNQQLISGTVSSSQGSTFSILLPVPTASGSTQTIKIQTQQLAANGEVLVVANGASSTVTTTSSSGIAEMLPNAVYLTANHPEQFVTFSNTGDINAALQQLTTTNPNIEVVFTPTSLTSGATTTATLKLKSTAGTTTSGAMELKYNDGQEEKTTAGVANQNIVPQPTPTPSPTPTTSPNPPPIPPAPTAGLTTNFAPNNDFYTTTATGTVSRQLTITNNGSTSENNFVLTLPANFTIGAGNSNSCTVTNPNTPAMLRDTLAANTGSCTITVTYNHNQTTNGNAGIIINYDYNNGTAAPIPATAAVNYRVTQSTANLSLSPNSPQNYGSIVSNNTQTSNVISYTLTNSGDETATNLGFNFGGDDSSLFHETGGSCTSGGILSNVSGSNTCTIATQFGPAPNGSAGAKSATFYVDYNPYTNGATVSTVDIALSGTVTAAPTATFSSNISANTFVNGGSGTSGSPYSGYINNPYTLSVTYTNTSAITATNFTTTLGTLPTGWGLTTHGCDGNQGVMAQNASCTDIYTLNGISATNYDLNLGSLVTASWTDSSGSYNNQTISGATIVYTSLTTPTPGAIIKVQAVGKNGFYSGNNNGVNLNVALAFPYNAASQTSATVTLTYQNYTTVDGDATNFSTTFNPLPSGWALITHGCNNVTLQANRANYCIDTYTFSSYGAESGLLKQVNGVYPTNIIADNIKQSWDEDSIHFANQPTVLPASYKNQIIYVNYFLKIFVTDATTTGQLSTNIGGNDAISNADLMCANDRNKPADGYIYKAILTTSTDNLTTPTLGKDRYVCKSVTCADGGEQSFDWVLLAESVNYRTSDTSVATTTIGVSAANYGYLTGIIARFSPTNMNVWTGFSFVADSWMSAPYNSTITDPGGSCNNWTSAGSALYGTDGHADSGGYNSIAIETVTCDVSQHLYCAQQVATK